MLITDHLYGWGVTPEVDRPRTAGEVSGWRRYPSGLRADHFRAPRWCVAFARRDAGRREKVVADPIRKKPALQVVREGNPSRRPVQEGLKLPPAELAEPNWLETFPAVRAAALQAVNKRSREVARREWRRVVPVLKYTAGLAEVDVAALQDYCVCVARIDQCEREISRRGMLLQGERGWQKNGATTVVSQYRAQYKIYLREFGLSPSARVSITPPGDDDDGDDVFD